MKKRLLELLVSVVTGVVTFLSILLVWKIIDIFEERRIEDEEPESDDYSDYLNYVDDKE